MRILNQTRRGYTLLELVVSMAAGSLLLVGMSSTLFIATQIVNTPRTADAVIDASRAAYNLADELQYAIYVTTRTDKLIEFAVSDRDGDNSPDVIRYQWSGTVGDSLFRTFNQETPQAVAENVHEFTLTYAIQEKNEEIATTVESDEEVLIGHAGSEDLDGFVVTPEAWIGQYFQPSDFSPPLPGDTISWSVTKVKFEARVDQAAVSEASVQLRTATGDYRPTSTVLEETPMPEESLSTGYRWEAFTFNNVSRLSPNSGLCLVVKLVSGESAGRIQFDDASGTGRVWTTDAGASWSVSSSDSMRYEVYGKYTTPGDTYIVPRKYLTGVGLSLRIGDDVSARVQSSAHILNSPELLGAYWHADLDVDPTAEDDNFDGDGDWVRRDGLSFDTGTLAGGVWQADATLDTYPDNDFSKVTTAEVRCRNTTVDTGGALFWINADWANGDFAPLFALIQLQADNTQTLTVHHKLDNATRAPLVTVAGLSDGFQLLRLVIMPDLDQVNVKVNGVDEGTYQYNTFSQANNDRFATITPWNSDAEFDYVSVRIAE